MVAPVRYIHAPYGYSQINFEKLFEINYSLTTRSVYNNTILARLRYSVMMYTLAKFHCRSCFILSKLMLWHRFVRSFWRNGGKTPTRFNLNLSPFWPKHGLNILVEWIIRHICCFSLQKQVKVIEQNESLWQHIAVFYNVSNTSVIP